MVIDFERSIMRREVNVDSGAAKQTIFKKYEMLAVHRWGHLTNSPSSVIFPEIQNHQIIVYLLNIMSIFDRCHRSSAVVTPVNMP